MPRKSSVAIDQEIEVLQAQIAILSRREDDFVRILEDMTRLRDSVRAESVALASQVTELERQKVPINWLPSELLIQIIVSLAEDNDPESEASPALAYGPSPVIISHVCQKWRKLALATSVIWSRISYRCKQWSASPVCAFLNRSGSCPLHLTYSPPLYYSDDPDIAIEEKSTFQRFLDIVNPQLFRVRSITFECTFPTTMQLMVETLVDNLHELKLLRSLDLSFANLGPSFGLTPLLTWDELGKQNLSDRPSLLNHLRLEQLPLRVIPSSSLRSVRSLELSYPPPRSHRASQYILQLSHIYRFLSFTSELQNLVLIDVAPLRDLVLMEHSGGQTESQYPAVAPLELPKLRSLTWKLACPRDMYTFMSFFNLPALKRCDIQIADSPNKRNDGSVLRNNHWHESDTQADPLGGVLSVNALKELYVSCRDGDSLISSLRQFLFPTLEQLEFAHAGKCPPNCNHKHPLPRLDYIFRDPRLPHLTHFTLSHLDVFAGHGKLMLSYMPKLVSLTLISCTGVDDMLQALAEAYGHAKNAEHKNIRGCGVRVCPKLQEMSLWGCRDFEFKGLFAVVFARAQPASGMPLEAKKGVSDADAVSAMLGRKIRPLKKLRAASTQGPSSTKSQTPSPNGVSSTLIPIEEGLRPDRIACVHLDDCPQITEDEALSLEELGTVVVYR